jgi:hypothetical protein
MTSPRPGQHRIGRAGNAFGQIVPRGKRLRLGHDTRRLRPQHGIGIGAAGIDTQTQRICEGGGHAGLDGKFLNGRPGKKSDGTANLHLATCCGTCRTGKYPDN